MKNIHTQRRHNASLGRMEEILNYNRFYTMFLQYTFDEYLRLLQRDKGEKKIVAQKKDVF